MQSCTMPRVCLCAAGKRAEVGVRYSSPQLTAGAVLQPATNKLSHVWLCGRQQGLTRECADALQLLTVSWQRCV